LRGGASAAGLVAILQLMLSMLLAPLITARLSRRGAGRLLAKNHKLKVELTVTQGGHILRTRPITFTIKRPKKHKHG
jgi:hypothetical protein